MYSELIIRDCIQQRSCWRKVCREIRRYMNPDIMAKASNLFVVSIDFQFSAHIFAVFRAIYDPHPVFWSPVVCPPRIFIDSFCFHLALGENATNKKCEKLNNLRLKSDFPKRRRKKKRKRTDRVFLRIDVDGVFFSFTHCSAHTHH